MALQVWMPFTDGTLKQQGLKNVSPTIGGTVNLTNAGKLGKCATIGTAAGGITLSASSMTSFTECSVAFWIKIISWNSSYATFFQAGLGSTPWNNYIFGILRNNAGSNLCFTLTNSSGTSSQAAYTTSNLNTGQWYHLAFTYKAGTICTYIDGELDKTYSTTYVPNFAGITHISIGRCTNNSGYQTNCNLNDFRIYDHCLSPKEVKQISQGLVLHYPLNRNGWGQENLLLNSGVFTSTSGWTNNQNTTLSVEDNELKVIINQTSSTPGIKVATSFSLVAGTYTASLLIKVENGNKNYVNYPFYMATSGGTALYGGSYTKKENKGGYIYEEATFSLASDADNVIFYILTSGPANGETWHLKWVKLEKGSIATPWCPNSSDTLATTMGLNSTTEYDCSGLCNNGSKMTNTITYTSDTAKYAVSTHFNGTYDGILIENFNLKDIINSAVTYAFWIKPESESGARSVYFGSYNTGPSWSIEKTTGNIMRLYWNGSPDESCSGATISDGVWQHICITKNGTNDVKVYINGVQKWTSTATHSNLNFPTTYRIGRDTRSNDGTPYKGLMSDFRIYATALSASDVKSLYQNCATIDPDGTIRGQIRS